MDQTFIPRGLPLMPRLHGLALKKIFDRPSLTKYEDYELSMGVEKYMELVTILTPADREDLHRIVDCLLADEELDYFSKQKHFIKKAELNYRKLYSNGLPYLDIYRPLQAPIEEPQPVAGMGGR